MLNSQGRNFIDSLSWAQRDEMMKSIIDHHIDSMESYINDQNYRPFRYMIGYSINRHTLLLGTDSSSKDEITIKGKDIEYINSLVQDYKIYNNLIDDYISD